MRQLLLGMLCAGAAYGQWSAIPSSSFPTLDAILNGKLHYQIVAGAPTSLGCTAGKDLAFNNIALTYHPCTVTGAPGTWGTFVTSPASAANGGTGQTTYTIGDLIYASGAAALSKLAGVAVGNVLISGGVATAPSWGKVPLTTHISGILPAANGGTGVANTATLTLGSANRNYATLGSGIMTNTTSTGAAGIATSSDIVATFGGGSCSGYLKATGGCDAGGSSPTLTAANFDWRCLIGCPAVSGGASPIGGGASTTASSIEFRTFEMKGETWNITTSSQVDFYITTVNSTSCGGSAANCVLQIWLMSAADFYNNVTPTITAQKVIGTLTTQQKAVFTTGGTLNCSTCVIAFVTDSATATLSAAATSGGVWGGASSLNDGPNVKQKRLGFCTNAATGAGTGTLTWPAGGCGTLIVNGASTLIPTFIVEL